MIRCCENCEKGVTGRQTNGKTVHRYVWWQLKLKPSVKQTSNSLCRTVTFELRMCVARCTEILKIKPFCLMRRREAYHGTETLLLWFWFRIRTKTDLAISPLRTNSIKMWFKHNLFEQNAFRNVLRIWDFTHIKIWNILYMHTWNTSRPYSFGSRCYKSKRVGVIKKKRNLT